MNFERLISIIKPIAEEMQTLARKAEEQYNPLVNHLINTKSKDIQKIEYTLDLLLDVAWDDRVLSLFKLLCRHLYSINPESAASYVYTWKEMWGEEAGMEVENRGIQ